MEKWFKDTGFFFYSWGRGTEIRLMKNRSWVAISVRDHSMWIEPGVDPDEINPLLDKMGTGVVFTIHRRAKNNLIAVKTISPPVLLAIFATSHCFRVHPFMTKDAPPELEQLVPPNLEEERNAFMLRTRAFRNPWEDGQKLEMILRRTPSENQNCIIDNMVETFRMKSVITERFQRKESFHRAEDLITLQDIIEMEGRNFSQISLQDGEVKIVYRDEVYTVQRNNRTDMFTFKDVQNVNFRLFLAAFAEEIALWLRLDHRRDPSSSMFSSQLSYNVVPASKEVFTAFWNVQNPIRQFFLWIFSVRMQAAEQGIENIAYTKLEPIIDAIATNSSADLVFERNKIFGM